MLRQFLVGFSKQSQVQSAQTVCDARKGWDMYWCTLRVHLQKKFSTIPSRITYQYMMIWNGRKMAHNARKHGISSLLHRHDTNRSGCRHTYFAQSYIEKYHNVVSSHGVLNIAVNLSCRILVTVIILNLSLWYFFNVKMRWAVMDGIWKELWT